MHDGPLEPRVSSAIQNLTTLEEEILAGNQRWYALRISPYKTLDHSIRGALVSFSDIDVRKRAEELTRDVGAYAARFLAAIGHPLLIVDRRLRILWANEPFLSAFQLSADETIGSTLTTVGTRELGDPELRRSLEVLFTTSSVFRGLALRLALPERGELPVRIGGSLIPASPEAPSALVSIEPAE